MKYFTKDDLQRMFDIAVAGQGWAISSGVAQHYSSLGFIREFGTIHINLPRRVGKTTALVDFLAPQFDPQDYLIVVPYLMQKETMHNCLTYRGIDYNPRQVIVKDSLLREAFCGSAYKVIAIDCAFAISDNRVEEIIKEWSTTWGKLSEIDVKILIKIG